MWGCAHLFKHIHLWCVGVCTVCGPSGSVSPHSICCTDRERPSHTHPKVLCVPCVHVNVKLIKGSQPVRWVTADLSCYSESLGGNRTSPIQRTSVCSLVIYQSFAEPAPPYWVLAESLCFSSPISNLYFLSLPMQSWLTREKRAQSQHLKHMTQIRDTAEFDLYLSALLLELHHYTHMLKDQWHCTCHTGNISYMHLLVKVALLYW